MMAMKDATDATDYRKLDNKIRANVDAQLSDAADSLKYFLEEGMR